MKKILYNADFITLDGENQNIEAILINNGKIEKVGKEKEVLALKDSKTEVIDLSKKTVMPSFIDAHSHFFAVANDLSQANLNNCKSFDDIQNSILSYVKQKGIKPNEWIIANNYDNNNLQEGRNITKEELDKAFQSNPIVLKHKSGHCGVLNSKGLQMLNITENTIAPDGGKIEKKDGKLTGYLEENAFIENIKKIHIAPEDELIKNVKLAQEKYASYGITTVQEGYLTKELIPIYRKIVEDKALSLDVVAYIDEKCEDIVREEFANCIKQYKNNFKIGGYKIFLDGSPQGRTAWMRTPYANDENYYGYGTMTDKEVERIIEKAYNNELQLLAHCNGDMAVEQFIHCIKKLGKNIEKIRPVLIHGQLIGIDQLEEIKKLGIIPSFFVAHTYYLGDVHIKNFGLERAEKISPAGSSGKEKIVYTFHQDSPVLEPNMFETIWCAVNRKTKQGITLGKDERISVIEAIKAVTVNSAYQYFEESNKGSIKEGKIADLIVVDKNPLKVDSDELRNIKVLETIKDGQTIYRTID